MEAQTPSDDIRRSAALTDDGDLLPPEVEVKGDVRQPLIDAVEAAIAATPNACDEPVLREPNDGRAERNVDAVFHANFNELPVMGDGPEIAGWLPPYRAREQFEESLYDHLPADTTVEALTSWKLGFYAD